MKQWIIRWLGLDVWMQGIMQEVGICKIASGDRVLKLEAENERLKEQNSELIQALLAKGDAVKPTTFIEPVRRMSVREQIAEMTKQSMEADRQALEKRKKELVNG